MSSELSARYASTRAMSESLCAPLAIEDHVVQPAPYVSPPKWHLAHTTWFFETFVLAEQVDGYRCFDPGFAHLFNSYYKSQGEHWQQAERGTLSRPTVAEVRAYRAAVDGDMLELLQRPLAAGVADTIELGIHHEQQHQELLLMDIKAILATNPSMPAYRERSGSTRAAALEWREHPGGQATIGVAADHAGFAFDNEGPAHAVTLTPHAIASRLVTSGEYLELVADGGYQRPDLWLSDGWDIACARRWSAPRYWIERDGSWYVYTLEGLAPLDPDAPVAHLSFYEADAYARWRGFRLPTEAEWEVAALDGQLDLRQELWQWTASPYVAYPGYRQPPGAFGEYNGKFMCNQMVLRGGCHATPASHHRVTYRNFYKPEMRWPFTGVRLARDLT